MSRLYRALNGVVLKRKRKCLTIRLETGETREVITDCPVKHGCHVHLYIDRSTNKVIRVETVGVPYSPIDEPTHKEVIAEVEQDNAIPPWERFVEDREVLGRQEGEEEPGARSLECQEVLGRQRSVGVEACSMLDDVFEENFLTQVSENLITIKEYHHE